MRRFSTSRCTTAMALFMSLWWLTAQAHAEPRHDPHPDQEVIRIALLLDTSNSMDGLINQARTHLWGVVNTFARARRCGLTPGLEVALFEYGNNNLPGHQGYMRQVLGMTSDLDAVSQALFSLTTNGGSEHCGQVIDMANRTLAWGPHDHQYRAIFIAGNEPFTQGPIHYTQACQQARSRGIVVNTIHCGSYDQGIAGMWQHGAKLALGTYLNIDQDHVSAPIHAPQDDRLHELNQQLNQTYLWFGKDRDQFAHNQREQDANARKMAPQAAVQRIESKLGGLYDNRSRDLVDAVEAGTVEIQALDPDDLPAPMRALKADQRLAYVQTQQKQRKKIQQEIQSLTAQRQAYLDQQQQQAASESNHATLGDAMIQAVTAQLVEQGYEIEKPQTP